MPAAPPHDATAVLADLTPLFRSVFKNERLIVNEATTARDVAGWDSLTQVELIVAVEKHYDIRFRLSDVMKFRNVGDLCQAVVKHAR